jgi:hypothetical protein
MALTACDTPSGTAETAAPKIVGKTAKVGTEIVMYKSPACECCTGWAEHLRQSGFTVIEKKQEDMDAIKSKYGVSENLTSCHTAVVNGYIVEGHVPAADVTRLLKERPKITGLTAPGMPRHSPGMQEPGKVPENYDVLAFDAEGKSHMFTRYYADGKFREFTR